MAIETPRFFAGVGAASAASASSAKTSSRRDFFDRPAAHASAVASPIRVIPSPLPLSAHSTPNDFDTALKRGLTPEKFGALAEESAHYGPVASRLPLSSETKPATRPDCEEYVRLYLDAAERDCANAIHRREPTNNPAGDEINAEPAMAGTN